MRYEPEHKVRTRDRIVRNTARKLRAEGLSGPGVASVMKASGLTVGGFYKHFRSMDGLVAEALAQAGGFIAIPRDTEDKYDTYFLKIDQCKFKQKVVPGDTLILKMELLHPIRRGICEMRGTVYVGDKIVTEAILIAQIVKRPKV